MKKTLQNVFILWEASAENDKAKSWQNQEPEKKNEHLPPKDAKGKKDLPSAKPTRSNEGPPVNWNTSEWDTLETKTEFVPGKDKDKDVMQLDQEQDKLHKLEEELAALGVQEEGLITPDMGTSVLGRSLFTGAALQPPNGYGPNFDPAGPAPEELPPGYEKNTVPDPIAPEEGSGFQHQDVAGTIIAPKQFLPRESKLVDHRSVTKRLAEQIARMERARKAKLR